MARMKFVDAHYLMSSFSIFFSILLLSPQVSRATLLLEMLCLVQPYIYIAQGV